MKVAQPLSSSGNLAESTAGRGRRDRRSASPRVGGHLTLAREAPLRAPVPEQPPEQPQRREEPALKLTKLQNTKIVVPRAPSTDPKVVERERLVASLLAAQGRVAITQVAQALVAAGHDIPDTQEAHLQLLEHGDDTRICASIAALSAILDREPAKRRPVLEQRLKRIEEFADEVATRDAAAVLRRKL